jgi:hypothetical protein
LEVSIGYLVLPRGRGKGERRRKRKGGTWCGCGCGCGWEVEEAARSVDDEDGEELEGVEEGAWGWRWG